jgi:hypothetical protein
LEACPSLGPEFGSLYFKAVSFFGTAGSAEEVGKGGEGGGGNAGEEDGSGAGGKGGSWGEESKQSIPIRCRTFATNLGAGLYALTVQKADTYPLPDLPLGNIRTDLLDSTHDLMPRHSWQFQAGIISLYRCQIRTTNATCFDA